MGKKQGSLVQCEHCSRSVPEKETHRKYSRYYGHQHWCKRRDCTKAFYDSIGGLGDQDDTEASDGEEAP